MKERRDVARAETRLADAVEAYEAIERDLELAISEVRNRNSDESHPIEILEVKPRKAGIVVTHFGLAWIPYWETEDGQRQRAIK